MTPETAIAQFIAGLNASCFLLLVSLGVTLLFGTARVFNFAHGGLFVVGGYASCEIAARLGWPFVPSVLLSVVAGLLVAALVYAVVFWRGGGPGADETQIVGSYGALLVIVECVRITVGSGYVLANTPAWLEGPTGVWGVSRYQVAVFALTIVLVIAVSITVKHTRFGRMVRAVADDAWLASTCGIRSEAVVFAVFLAGSALAVLTGAVYVGMGALTPSSGDDLIVAALAVTLLGGRGNIKGACIASFLLGQVNAFGVVLAPRLASSVPYALTVAILAIRPAGLLRAHVTLAAERRI